MDIMSDEQKAEELWQWTEREFREHGFSFRAREDRLISE